MHFFVNSIETFLDLSKNSNNNSGVFGEFHSAIVAHFFLDPFSIRKTNTKKIFKESLFWRIVKFWIFPPNRAPETAFVGKAPWYAIFNACIDNG